MIEIPIAGQPVTQTWGESVADAMNAVEHLGRAGYAYPVGFSASDVSSAATSFGVVAAGLGGAMLQPIYVPAPMYLQSVSIRQGATSGAKTAEFALYYDTGSTTLTRVEGTAGTFSFTPTAADDRSADIGTPGTLINPGFYFLAIRNTSASEQFSVRRLVATELVFSHSLANNSTKAAALGATLDYSATGWAAQVSMYLVRLNGRVMGQASAF